MSVLAGLLAVGLLVSCDSGEKVVTGAVVFVDASISCIQPVDDSLSEYCVQDDQNLMPSLKVGDCVTTRSFLDEPRGGDGTRSVPEDLLTIKLAEGACG